MSGQPTGVARPPSFRTLAQDAPQSVVLENLVPLVVESTPASEVIPEHSIQVIPQREPVAQAMKSSVARLHPQQILVDRDDINDGVLKCFDMRIASSRSGQLAFNPTSLRFERYGLDPLELGIRPWDTSSRPDYARIEKQVRIRVRYCCHLCSLPMGTSRNCLGCNHQQCHQCLRNPPRKVIEWPIVSNPVLLARITA